MLDDETDAALVQRVAAASADAREAEAALCRRFAPRIRLYGLRHLRDEERAKDLVQVVLVAFLEAARAGRVKELEHVHRFVLGICRHTATRTRLVERRAEPVADIEQHLAGEGNSSARADLGALLHCFGHLDQRSREVVLLSLHEGRDAAEIAELLALSAGNVRVLRHRAVLSLRRCLDGAEAQG